MDDVFKGGRVSIGIDDLAAAKGFGGEAQAVLVSSVGEFIHLVHPVLEVFDMLGGHCVYVETRRGVEGREEYEEGVGRRRESNEEKERVERLRR